MPLLPNVLGSPPAFPVSPFGGWRARVAVGLACVCLAPPAPAAGPGDGISARPLEAPSGPRGATLFVELPSSATGLATENRYADPGMWWDRYQEFIVGAIGSGVAIGDYDNDGRPDVFVVSKTEACRLFRNLGGWRFQDVTVAAGVTVPVGFWARGLARAEGLIGRATPPEGGPVEAWKTGAAFADVNNDGWLDLYVTRFNAPNLLYLNRGDGTFAERAAAAGLAVVDASVMGVFGDYDRDGWLDLYLATNLLEASRHPAGQRDRLFHNRGDGTFEDVTERAGIAGETQDHSATWWDYDNDGWPDLYVAVDFAVPDRLYHNNRDGTFTNRIGLVVPHTPYSSMGSDFGDVNNDGRIDFLVADMAATTREKDHRGMAESRASHRDHPDDPEAAPQFLRSALYLNTGAGVCLEAATLAGLAATDWTWSPRFEDLDNDGCLDFHATNGMVREDHNADLLARMMATESAVERVRLKKNSPVLDERNLAYRNLGDLRFEEVGAAWGLDQVGVSFGSAFGDLDGDGDLDLVFNNFQTGAVVLRNDSDSGHRIVFALRGTVSNRFGVGAVVRLETGSGLQVRQLFPARGCVSSSEPILHFGLGGDTVVRRATVSWPSGHVQVFADLEAGRRYTVTEPAAPADLAREPAGPPPAMFVEAGAGLGLAFASREAEVDETAVQRLLPVRQNRRGPALAVGGLDGQDDIVLGGTTLDPARVSVAAAAGGFRLADTGAALSHPAVNDGPILVFDTDADDRQDLLVTRGGSARPAGAAEYQPALFLNRGAGALVRAPAGALPPLPVSAGAAVAADFNRDGRLDLFIGGRVEPGAYPLPPRSALLANRGGSFEDVTSALAPGLERIGMVTSALWSDVDDDGWPDLLLALEWGGVAFWRNDQGRGFEDRSQEAGFAAAGSGWWTSLAAADFNGDGRVDYVAGNVGLNTPYRASPAQPALLFVGDFGGSGSSEILEAQYDEEGRIVPWRAHKTLATVIPSIRRRFKRVDDYARATLGEIVGEERLAAAQRFAATEFRSGVFLSQPDRRFRFQPLPRLAQVSPFQGVAAGDFDGDGHADIFAVQNSSAPIPYAGRFDGGLGQLLRGDGGGGFAPVPPAESGLIVRGDAKALAVLDLDRDGWPDFVVSRNNDTTLAFRNTPAAGRGFLRVDLRGPTGNPTAVGARVSAEHADGTRQTLEVHAGSGSMSQSSAACFLGYREVNPPRRLHVRWPSGESTVHEVPSGAGKLILAAPR